MMMIAYWLCAQLMISNLPGQLSLTWYTLQHCCHMRNGLHSTDYEWMMKVTGNKMSFTSSLGQMILTSQQKAYLRYSINHVQAHLNSAMGMVRARFRQARYTIVTVTQNLDPQTMVVLNSKNNLHSMIHRLISATEVIQDWLLDPWRVYKVQSYLLGKHFFLRTYFFKVFVLIWENLT